MECPTAPKREDSRSANPRSVRPVKVPKRRKNSMFHDTEVKRRGARYRIGAQKKGIAKQMIDVWSDSQVHSASDAPSAMRKMSLPIEAVQNGPTSLVGWIT